MASGRDRHEQRGDHHGRRPAGSRGTGSGRARSRRRPDRTVAPPPPSAAYRAVLPNHWMNVPYPSTFWKSSPNVWKNSNGLREPEAERLEDVRLGLRRVDDDPGDRDQREDREQERERGQQRDGAAAQPVQLDGDLAVARGEPLLPPALAAGLGAAAPTLPDGGGRRRGDGHASSPLRLRTMSDSAEIDDDDHGEDHRHRGGEVGLVAGDGRVPDEVGGRVVDRDRALLEVLEDLRLGEQLERADRVEEDQHDDRRADQGQLDPQDDLPQRGVVEDGGLDDVAGHRLERRVEDHHVVAGPLPDDDHDDRRQDAGSG